MEIKTVWDTMDRSAAFDVEVNELLADGWQLVKREVLPGENYGVTAYGKRLLYAELVKLDEADMETREPDPPSTWQEAVEVICQECKAAAGCDERCPAFDWCQEYIPDEAIPPKFWSVTG